MNNTGNNNLNQNTNPTINNNNNIPNTPNNIPPQVQANGQVLYDQYGNPVNVAGNQTNQNINVQSPPQVEPQVMKQVSSTSTVSGQNPQITPQQVVSKPQPPKKEKKRQGNARYVLLILFFISLLVMVWFLPDIRKFVTDRKIQSQEEIITGTLKCVYEEDDELITTLYTSEFVVENNKLKSLTQTTETKGDTGSEEQLTKINDECEMLTTMVNKISGIGSNCSLNSRKQISKQEIDYRKVNKEKLSAAYSEAGGVMPDYDLDEDAREIKREMTLARYSCTVN